MSHMFADQEDRIVASLVGRRIVAAQRWDDEDSYGGGVRLTLDDGRIVTIEAGGHSWHHIEVSETLAEEK